MSENKNNILLDVQDLTFSFNTYAGEVQAVRGVSFTLEGARAWALWVSPAAANPLRQNPLSA